VENLQHDAPASLGYGFRDRSMFVELLGTVENEPALVHDAFGYRRIPPVRISAISPVARAA
jgi:hypothetical protein